MTYEGADAIKTRPRGKDSDPIEAQIKQLDHPSYHERRRAQTGPDPAGQGRARAGRRRAGEPDDRPGRQAAPGLGASTRSPAARPRRAVRLIDALKSPVADVRAQAARALGERAVPIAEEPLIALLKDREPAVRLQAVDRAGADRRPRRRPRPAAGAGRHGRVPRLLGAAGAAADRRLAGGGQGARLARSEGPRGRPARHGAGLRRRRPSTALIRFAESAARPIDERIKAIRFLAEVHRKAPPWDGKWWGTQPAKGEPPARTIAWEGTPSGAGGVPRLLRDPSAAIRIAAVDALAEAKDQESLPTIRSRFDGEKDAEVRRAIALALGKLEDRGVARHPDRRAPRPAHARAGPRRLARGRRDDRHRQGREGPGRAADAEVRCRPTASPG